MLKSNIAACHLKLEDWKEAIKAATAALDNLDKLQGMSVVEKKGGEGDEEVEEEIISQGAEKAEDTSSQGQREADIERIRTKALLRRARARSETGGWSSLQGAEEGMLYCILELVVSVLTSFRLQDFVADAESHCSRSKAGPATATGPTTSDQGSPGE